MLSKKNKGITLVALVITIIILLILAGISISALTNTGIFEKAKEAKGKSENAQKQEESLLTNYESELIKYAEGDKWDGKVNKPELMTGMKEIQFNDPTDSTEGSVKEVTDSSKNDWYNYDEKKWANAQTEDGSMWVWIPRYAYKVVYKDPSDKSKGGTFDIVFLIGITDNYYDENGNLQTAQRQTSENQTIETDSTKTDKYTVHPAFTDESKINYTNGGWKKELAGIWVSKFEAGFASGNNNAPVKASNVNYSQARVWGASNETGTGKDDWVTARNWLDKEYGEKTTAIKYPTFQGLTYSMNYINHSDAFSISKALTDDGNIYGLKSSTTDSHLIKNNEWGAVAYLGQSKYGLNGTNIYINNVNLNNSTTSVYAVTGCAASTADAISVGTTIDKLNKRSQDGVYVWTQKNGTKASSTGTIYGIYDMSGGTWERSATIVNNGNGNLNTYGKAIMNALNNGKSTAYVTVYPKGETSGQSLDDSNKGNYAANTKIYGDAIRETSTAGEGRTSWYSDYSYFAGADYPFFVRGGSCWDTSVAGLFYFNRVSGNCGYGNGFRSVLVAQ